ncbi:MAG: response regulator [Planctomycetes bacterium]|nr:response regulator [Planctomycetota bacterium]
MPECHHNLLRRQIRRYLGGTIKIPVELLPFLDAVSQAYRDSDADRTLSERALDISSAELFGTNAKLRYQRDLFLSFMNNSPLVAYMKNERGRYSYVNLKFEDLVQRPSSEILGRTDSELSIAEHPHEKTAPAVADMQPGDSMEVMERWQVEGEPHEWLVQKFAVSDDDGRRHVASLGMDVTESRRAEEQLRQSQKLNAIGRLAGGIAHDFNNLLTVIIGYSQVLHDRFAGDPESRTDLDEILKASERAAGLTRQLLVFSRKQVVQPKRLDVNEVLGEMDRMLRRLIGEDVQFAVISKDQAWPVRADAGHLQQVIMNLVLNARDAMPRGGKLTIETANTVLDDSASKRVGLSAGEYLVISVTDTGTGMSADVRARLFEPFFTTKKVGQGTGLGLSTAYGIVTQSLGNITVYSEVGHGSTFRVYLPRLRDENSSRAPATASRTVPRGKERILVVEDEDSLRGLIATRLQAAGYLVEVARDGAEALSTQLVGSPNFDLVISDVVMPKMGGTELAAKMKASSPRVKVLLMSGYPDGAMVQAGEISEEMPFINKPFATADLLRKVRETLDSR